MAEKANSKNNESRRTFLKKSSTVVAGTAALVASARARAVHASGSDVIKIGLIGCGGRGTGATKQALTADKGNRLVAMGDAFADRLDLSRSSLSRQEEVASQIDVPKDRQFVGFDAYKHVIDHVDVVLLATPPGFRPLHLKAAVDAGKHIFAEKPVAVDAPGVRSVLATCELAAKKNLSVVSGLCLRYSYGFQDIARRIHDGQIGRVTSLRANDYRGGVWVKPRQPDWSDMVWQMRNWYYFTWLSGDFNVEQHVHFLDVCAWAMNNVYPDRALGMGGRLVRTGPEYGHIFDHHSVIYSWDDGPDMHSNTRHMRECKNLMSAEVVGTKGVASFSERNNGLWIEPHGQPEKRYVYSGEDNHFYQTEHDELFASIRSGKPINNGEYMAKSTMLAILGRMCTYTGQEISWKDAMASQEKLGPDRYDWDVPLEVPPVAQPGKTKFV